MKKSLLISCFLSLVLGFILLGGFDRLDQLGGAIGGSEAHPLLLAQLVEDSTIDSSHPAITKDNSGETEHNTEPSAASQPNDRQPQRQPQEQPASKETSSQSKPPASTGGPYDVKAIEEFYKSLYGS